MYYDSVAGNLNFFLIGFLLVFYNFILSSVSVNPGVVDFYSASTLREKSLFSSR